MLMLASLARVGHWGEVDLSSWGEGGEHRVQMYSACVLQHQFSYNFEPLIKLIIDNITFSSPLSLVHIVNYNLINFVRNPYSLQCFSKGS